MHALAAQLMTTGIACLFTYIMSFNPPFNVSDIDILYVFYSRNIKTLRNIINIYTGCKYLLQLYHFIIFSFLILSVVESKEKAQCCSYGRNLNIQH